MIIVRSFSAANLHWKTRFRKKNLANFWNWNFFGPKKKSGIPKSTWVPRPTDFKLWWYLFFEKRIIFRFIAIFKKFQPSSADFTYGQKYLSFTYTLLLNQFFYETLAFCESNEPLVLKFDEKFDFSWFFENLHYFTWITSILT